jgi:hypothetical protein
VERAEQAIGVLGDVQVLSEGLEGAGRWRAVSMRHRLSGILPILALAASPAFAQISAKPSSTAPPDAIAPALKSLLAPAGATVTAGPATLDFWWVSALPSKSSDWSQVPEGSLVGAVRVAGAFKEIRGKTVKPGVYTLRLGLQPQNGDHLGVAPNREFLLLSPAEADTDPKALGFDGTVAISKQTIGASHPAALSLDPPISTGAPLSAVSNEMDHKGVTFEIKTASGGTLKFGLILIGIIEH